MPRWLLLMVLGGLSWAPSAFSALYLDLGWDYRRGDFGTGSQITLQAPWVGMSRYGSDGWAASAVIPYFRLDDGQETVSGIGDVFTSVSRMVAWGRWTPVVGGLVKWPTANADTGLGTGAFDATVQLGLGYALRSDLRLLGQWGHTFAGDSDQQRYENYASHGLGVYHQRGAVGWSLWWNQRDNSIPGGEVARELGLGVGRFFAGRWRLQGSLLRGLSDGAADWSGSAALSWRL